MVYGIVLPTLHTGWIWLVVWNMFYFSIYWELIIPTNIFQRGRLYHQSLSSWSSYSYYPDDHPNHSLKRGWVTEGHRTPRRSSRWRRTLSSGGCGAMAMPWHARPTRRRRRAVACTRRRTRGGLRWSWAWGTHQWKIWKIWKMDGEWAESCNIYVYFRIFWKIMGGRWIFPAMLMSGRQVGLKRLKNPERNECNQAI